MSYVQQLKSLVDEINSELSIWDLYPVLGDWFDQLDTEAQKELISLGFDYREQDNFANGKYFQKFHKDFREYADNNMEKVYNFYHIYGEGPANLDKGSAKLIKNEWLVNFSHKKFSNCQNGFTVGLPFDYKEGKLTNMNESLNEPGWNFAYEASYRPLKNNRFIQQRVNNYGPSISLFRSNGVSFEHYGDRERQVMFLGEYVRRIYCVTYEEWSGNFSIEITSGKNTKEVEFSSLEEVADFIDGYYKKSNISGYIDNSKKHK